MSDLMSAILEATAAGLIVQFRVNPACNSVQVRLAEYETRRSCAHEIATAEIRSRRHLDSLVAMIIRTAIAGFQSEAKP